MIIPTQTTVPITMLKAGIKYPEIKVLNLKPLVDQIKTNGMLEPIAVRVTSEGYSIIMGHKRYWAAYLAGLNEVPVITIQDNLQDYYGITDADNNGKQILSDMEAYTTTKLMHLGCPNRAKYILRNKAEPVKSELLKTR